MYHRMHVTRGARSALLVLPDPPSRSSVRLGRTPSRDA